MKWFKRILWGLLGLVVLLVIAGGAGFWYLTRHGGTDIREAGLVGRFYAAPGTKHHTAVLMLGGSNGGYPYDSAAQNLADAGYPVFALAYFKSYFGRPTGLPKYLANIPLEYFFHAIDWMKKRPEVNPDRIVLMGESRGGELVLLLASLRPDVAGVIAYSPSNYVWAGIDPTYRNPAWRLGGRPVPFLTVRTFSFKHAVASFEHAIATATPAQRAAAAIPVEKIHGPVLLISSKTDNLWPSSEMSDAVEARLKAHHFRYRIENVQYRNASHLLMGYGPGIVRLGIPFVGGFYFGGTPEGTRIARDSGWAKAKAFIARIGNTATPSAGR
ncbi:MAG: alpha/beta hydrolase [Rhizomicrobium sp.]